MSAAKHDCWNPGCIVAQRAGQSCALCLGCQIIRDALYPERRAAVGVAELPEQWIEKLMGAAELAAFDESMADQKSGYRS